MFVLYIDNPWLWHEGQYCLPVNTQKDDVYNKNLRYGLNEAQDLCASALHKKKGAYATLIYQANHPSCYLHERCVYNNHSLVNGYYLYTTQQRNVIMNNKNDTFLSLKDCNTSYEH